MFISGTERKGIHHTCIYYVYTTVVIWHVDVNITYLISHGPFLCCLRSVGGYFEFEM